MLMKNDDLLNCCPKAVAYFSAEASLRLGSEAWVALARLSPALPVCLADWGRDLLNSRLNNSGYLFGGRPRSFLPSLTKAAGKADSALSSKLSPIPSIAKLATMRAWSRSRRFLAPRRGAFWATQILWSA